MFTIEKKEGQEKSLTFFLLINQYSRACFLLHPLASYF